MKLFYKQRLLYSIPFRY